MDAQQLWEGLDEAWREAFRQAWDAVRGGNIGVGVCASTVDGKSSTRRVTGWTKRAGRMGRSSAHPSRTRKWTPLQCLMPMEVDQVLAAIWPRLQALTAQYRAV